MPNYDLNHVGIRIMEEVDKIKVYGKTQTQCQFKNMKQTRSL